MVLFFERQRLFWYAPVGPVRRLVLVVVGVVVVVAVVGAVAVAVAAVCC